MRKLLTILPLALLIGITACKKKDEDPNDKGPECQLAGAENLTYNTHLKAIIDEHCITCHNGQGVGPGDYTTYEGIKPKLDDGEVLEFVVIDRTMPQGGGMSQAERDSVNCWIKNGYPK